MMLRWAPSVVIVNLVDGASYPPAKPRRMTMTPEQATQAFRTGNNNGEGYAPYTDVPGDNTVDNAIAAFEADGFTVDYRATTDSEVSIIRGADGEVIALGGDAMGCNDWAVVIQTA
jgi:hypothetical protein